MRIFYIFKNYLLFSAHSVDVSCFHIVFCLLLIFKNSLKIRKFSTLSALQLTDFFFYLYTSLWLLTKCISLEVPGLFSSFSFNCVSQSLSIFIYEKWLLYKSAISFGGCVCVCAQPSLTLRDPMNCSLPVFSVHGIFQARILENIQNGF